MIKWMALLALIFTTATYAQEELGYDEVNIRYYKNLEVKELENKDGVYLLAPSEFRVEYAEGSDCILKFSKNGHSFTDDTLCRHKQQE